MPATEPRVVPRPRRIELTPGTVRFTTPFEISTSDDDAEPALTLLETLLERETNESVAGTTDEVGSDVHLSLSADPSETFDDPEGYVLTTDDDGITIRAGTVDGLRHGCQTVVGGITPHDGCWAFPACEIHDWPETSWRGFMLDPARGFLPVDRVKRRIDQAARAKLNRVHLHLLDHESYALESDAFPELNLDADGTDRPAYTPTDIEELIDYADRRGIRIVPEIDVPSHARHVLETYPELQCTVRDGDPSDRTMCLGKKATVDFVETLLGEVLEQFPFHVVHVGGDEWAMGHSWDECVDCRAAMDEAGAETLTEHFYSFVRHVHGVLDDHDRRMMLWNDQIDISDSPDLPRDALVQFWRVAGPDRGPVEGCSMERFLAEEFDVVNSYVHAAYVNGWISEEYMLGWEPRSRPTVPAGRKDQVRGGELLAWEPSDEPAREYFERALPSAIPTFADRLWNAGPIADRSSFARSLTRHALGPFVPDGFDIYRELGGLILPTSWKRSTPSPLAHVHSSLGDRTAQEAAADYREVSDLLSTLQESGETVYPETASAYLDCLEWLVDVAERDGQGVIDRPSETTNQTP